MSSNKSVPFVIPLVAEISCFVGPSENGAVRTDGLAGRMGLGKLDESGKDYHWFLAENNLETETETTWKNKYIFVDHDFFLLQLIHLYSLLIRLHSVLN